MLSRVSGWWSGPSGVPGVTRLNGLLALILSVFVVLTSSASLDATDPRGSVWVCAAALLMTLPVAWRRDAPLAAIAALAAGAVFNWLVVGSYVRCGGALPSLFLCLFSVADRCALKASLIGLALAFVSGIAQGESDPQLKGFAGGACVILTLLWAAGRLVRSRQAMVTALRTRNDELRVQRDRTAQLAVAADRAKLARDLDGAIGQRIDRLAQDAAAASVAVADEPTSARASLAAIEDEGRQTLNQMRELVGTLRDDQPTDPEPSLNDLDGLLARLAPGRAELIVEGDRSRLPAGVELSAFRIIERLLEPLENATDTRVVVLLRYAPEELEVRVQGRVRSEADFQTPLAAAREWVSLHAGRLDSELRSGVSTTDVRLPLVTTHA
jgi:signal transduction histidine kinase